MVEPAEIFDEITSEDDASPIPGSPQIPIQGQVPGRRLNDSTDSDSSEPTLGDILKRRLDGCRKCKRGATDARKKPLRERSNTGSGQSGATPKRSKSATHSANKENSAGDGTAVEKTLMKTNKFLSTLIKRMDRQEERIVQIEQKMDDCVLSSSTPSRPRKKEVPMEVRVNL